MSAPAPLRAFLGGLGLAAPVHELLSLNGSVFGISGFLHRAFRGSPEAIASVAGLFGGGIVIGLVQTESPSILNPNYSSLALSGFLVGVGTKWGNGCTSGHMIAGLSRFSVRSAVAVATFVFSAILTARSIHGDSLSSIQNAPFDWELGHLGKVLLALQSIPFLASIVLHSSNTPNETRENTKTRPFLRCLAAFATAIQFSFALRLSNLSSPACVTRFLLTPLSPAFDPSLAFLGIAAIPTASFLYHKVNNGNKPKLGGSSNVPTNSKVDAKLIIGALLFGIGWGIQGICPGPAIINLGIAASQRHSSFYHSGAWLASTVVGGFVASIVF